MTIPTDAELSQAYQQGYDDALRWVRTNRPKTIVYDYHEEPMTEPMKLKPAIDHAVISALGEAAGNWAAELDAMTTNSSHWVVYQNDPKRALRSIVAKVNGNLIAPEHGTPQQIAQQIANSHNTIAELTTALRDILSLPGYQEVKMREIARDALDRLKETQP